MICRFLVILLLFSSCFSPSATEREAEETYAEITVEETAEFIEVDSLEKETYLDLEEYFFSEKSTENTIYPKKWKEDFQEKYSDKAFNYSENKPKESIMDRIVGHIGRWLGPFQFKGVNQTGEFVLKILLFLIATAALYFVIIALLKRGGLGIFEKSNQETGIPINGLTENIHEIDFIKEIFNFEQKGNFRYAVRYQYLYALKKLTDRKLIDWNPEKTNKDYVREFNDPKLKKQFREISYIFDYVWYGKFEINKTNYQEFKKKFEDFVI